jgi:Family of unknown function (DUF5924)/Protein of unknown function (DUF2914)
MSEARSGGDGFPEHAGAGRSWLGLRRPIRRVLGLHHRYPWLVPAVSFVAGWIGFVMVRRGEAFARGVAVLALSGWLWLLIEPWIRRQLERRRPRIGNFVVNFVSQSLQQELLFFSLPFLIGATQADAGQIAFTTLVGVAALVSTLDPVYERYVATRAARRLSFHAFCSWIAALVVLPMVLSLPVERALPISVVAVSAWLLLTLPLSLHSLKRKFSKALWIVGVLVLPFVLWELRARVPAAGLAVTSARVTQTIVGLTPGEPVRRLTQADLGRGVIAFAAIRAPAGLAQEVVFEWRHNGRERERISAEIHGGKADGFRTFSRKLVFPADAVGVWTVDLLTPQQQLLHRLKFVVEG